MAKASLTYVGTHDDPTTEITAFGETFEKGKAVQVDKDSEAYRKLSGNPTFVTADDEGGKARIAEAKKEAKAADEADEG